MSKVENEAKPRITALLQSPSVTLTAPDQAAIAVWAAKSAMVFEALRPDRKWFYRQDERERLKTAKELPPRTYIWIAPVVDNLTFFCTATDMSETAERDASETHGYVTTFAFNSLAMQVLTLRPRATLPASTPITLPMTPAPWDAVTIPLHPKTHGLALWPSASALNGELGLTLLADRWRAASTGSASP